MYQNVNNNGCLGGLVTANVYFLVRALFSKLSVFFKLSGLRHHNILSIKEK